MTFSKEFIFFSCHVRKCLIMHAFTQFFLFLVPVFFYILMLCVSECFCGCDCFGCARGAYPAHAPNVILPDTQELLLGVAAACPWLWWWSGLG